MDLVADLAKKYWVGDCFALDVNSYLRTAVVILDM